MTENRQFDASLREFADKLFGPAAVYGEILDQLAAAAHAGHCYTFMAVEEFAEEAMQHGPRWANKVYWIEMLQRAHWAALTSACRHKGWLFGALVGAESANFLAFAASMRGLVEACADSYHSLSTVSLTIGENYAEVREAIIGRLDILLTSADVENLLIHFQFAGEHKVHGLPPAYHARRARDYIESIAGDDTGIVELYRSLCGFTHPTDASLSWLVARPDSATAVLTGPRDLHAIRMMCEQHRPAITETLERGVNSDLLMLKTLNQFALSNLRTPYVDTLRMPHTPAWVRIHRAIEEANLGG